MRFPGYSLKGDDDGEFWGYARDATGLFTPLADGTRRVELMGFKPEGALGDHIGRIGTKRACAGNATIAFLDSASEPFGDYFLNSLTPVDVRPAPDGIDLTVTVEVSLHDAPPEAGPIWDLIRTGRLDRPNLWHSHSASGRHAWLSVALRHRAHRDRPDAPPGTTYEIDGNHIADELGFYCALGEAVNGPGGYFGWNLNALIDCLRGGWGATTPFTLVWRHHRTAVPYLTGRLHHGGTLFAELLEIFDENGVDVRLD